MLTFDVFWSMRSPYCYLVLDRLLELCRARDVKANLRIVYPIAIRNQAFFKSAPKHYRPYHLQDSQRVAEFLGIPYRRPRPDPVTQDMETHEVAADQPLITRLTRLATAAAEAGAGLAFLDKVMRLIWDGETDGWNEGTHLADVVAQAGLDLQSLEDVVNNESQHLEQAIDANRAAQLKSGHTGVPLFVFDGEPFFGQDRFELLVWRMEQRGLTRR